MDLTPCTVRGTDGIVIGVSEALGRENTLNLKKIIIIKKIEAVKLLV